MSSRDKRRQMGTLFSRFLEGFWHQTICDFVIESRTKKLELVCTLRLSDLTNLNLLQNLNVDVQSACFTINSLFYIL